MVGVVPNDITGIRTADTTVLCGCTNTGFREELMPDTGFSENEPSRQLGEYAISRALVPLRLICEQPASLHERG